MIFEFVESQDLSAHTEAPSKGMSLWWLNLLEGDRTFRVGVSKTTMLRIYQSIADAMKKGEIDTHA